MEVDPWELLLLRLAHEITPESLAPLALALGAPAGTYDTPANLLKWLTNEEFKPQQAHHDNSHFRQRTIQRLRVAFSDANVKLTHMIRELDAFKTQYPTLVSSDSASPPNALSTSQVEAPGVLSRAVGILVPTIREKNLFEFLLEVNRVYNLGCTLRVSGGWVRDKLMGAESDDIDLALDKMYGKDFAEKVNQHLTLQHYETHRIGVIKQNPEQSKHLETATMKVFDIWVDFVHLRSESYSGDSRIPHVEFGTPEQDALRRDLTINALFYNLNEDKVEDFSGKGLHDLHNRIIRTPLAPLTTFLDDPLRVLRAVRFTSRLEFRNIDPELLEAARNPTVQEALRKKISRERIATELDGMLAVQKPILAFTHLHTLGLFNIIFELPPEHAKFPPFQFADPALHLVLHFTRLREHYAPCRELNADQRRILLLALALWPVAKLRYTVKNRPVPVSAYVIKQSLKGKLKDAADVELLHDEGGCMMNLASNNKCERKIAGVVLRRAATLWPIAWMLGLTVRLAEGPAPPPTGEFNEKEHAIINSFELLKAFFADSGLVGPNPCWELKPLITGDELASIVHISPGPMFKELIQQEIEYQLEHPTATREQVVAWLKEKKI